MPFVQLCCMYEGDVLPIIVITFIWRQLKVYCQ